MSTTTNLVSTVVPVSLIPLDEVQEKVVSNPCAKHCRTHITGAIKKEGYWYGTGMVNGVDRQDIPLYKTPDNRVFGLVQCSSSGEISIFLK